MGATVIRALRRTTFDFNNCLSATAGKTSTLLLARNIDASAFTRGTVLVRLHQNGIPASGPSFEVTARTTAPTDDEPAVDYDAGGDLTTTISFSTSSSVGLLTPQTWSGRAGAFVSLFLLVTTGTVSNAVTFTISVDLVLDDPPWDPLLLGATALEGWEDWTVADGPVSSWVGRKLGTTLVQGTPSLQPVKNATGVVFDGTDDILSVAFGSILSGRTTARVVFACLDAATAVKVLLEYSTNSNTQPGGFGLYVNDGGADRISGSHFNVTQALAYASSQTLATMKVVSIGVDYSNTEPTRWIRVNGVSQSLTRAGSVTATAFGNHSLFIGARSGSVLPDSLTLRQLWWLSGANQDEDLERTERYVAAQVGLSW